MRMLLFLLISCSVLVNPTKGIASSVQFVYLSPLDKAYNSNYEAALERAVTELRLWFAEELDGFTFQTASDSVSWHQLPHETAWYQTNPPNREQSIRFWESVLFDAFEITAGRFDDPLNRWIYYIDADHLPGQLVGGTNGVALLPANDLRGLNGESLVPINPGDAIENPGFDRWVGGLGHELGHALGLPHPPTSPGGEDDASLMWLGYLNFPDTYLRTEDRETLTASEFFQPIPLPGTLLLFVSSLLILGKIRSAPKTRSSAVADCQTGQKRLNVCL